MEGHEGWTCLGTGGQDEHHLSVRGCQAHPFLGTLGGSGGSIGSLYSATFYWRPDLELDLYSFASIQR